MFSMKRLLVLLAAILLLGACTLDHVATHSNVNSARIDHGLNALRYDETAHRKAQAHAERMAAEFVVPYHSRLADGMGTVAWQNLGENVGVGWPGVDVHGVHDAFMRSPTHRANILDRRWDLLGVGVAHSNGYTWVVHVFVDVG